MQPMDFIQKNPRIEMNNDLCYTWRFVFKRNFLINKKIRFIKNLHVGEDTVFNYECVLQASSIIMIPKALYQYRINNAGSLMRLRYKPYLTNNLQKLVDEKKRLIRKYNIEHYIPITTDLSEKSSCVICRCFSTIYIIILINRTRSRAFNKFYQ